MKSDALSIVIPVKDRASLIVRCLDSIKAQDYRPLNIIVVDNASADNTKSVVEQWAQKNSNDSLDVTILEEKRPGAAAARNCGLETVKTEWMLFFDSDDTMLPEMTGCIMRQAKVDPQLDLIYWNCLIHTSKGNKKKTQNFKSINIWERQIYNALLSTQSYAVKTEFIRKAGGWNNSLLGWDDWELGIRLLLGKPKMKALPEPLVIIYPQTESITGIDYNSKAGLWEEAIDASEKAVENSVSDTTQRNRLIRMINYRRTNLAALYKHEGRKDLADPLLLKSLNHPTTTGLRKILLRLIYCYTSLGGRMAYIFWT